MWKTCVHCNFLKTPKTPSHVNVLLISQKPVDCTPTGSAGSSASKGLAMYHPTARVLKTADSSFNALFLFPNFWKTDVWNVLPPARLQWHVSTRGVAKSQSFFFMFYFASPPQRNLALEFDKRRNERFMSGKRSRQNIGTPPGVWGSPEVGHAQCERKTEMNHVVSSVQENPAVG